MRQTRWAQGRNFLITASPGEGKTTFVRRLAGSLRDLEPAGFYTEEMRHEGRRTGFRIVGLDGREAVLAHVNLPLPSRVGRSGVDARALDEFLRGLSTRGRRLILLDEIGKMECFSPTFRGLVHHWLDGPAAVVGTFGEKGPGLIADVKRRPDCELHLLDRADFSRLLGELEDRVRAAVTAVREMGNCAGDQ